MSRRITWTVDHRGLSRLPLRVAVTLAGMPWSVLLAFFVVAPLAVTGVVLAVGDAALEFAAVAWFVAVLFVWFTSAGAAHTEYALDPDARRLEIEQLGVGGDYPLVAALGGTATIDLERVADVGAVSLFGTTVITVSYDGLALARPTAFEVRDADRARVHAALEAAGLRLPTAADGRVVDHRTRYVRGSAILVGLALTIVGPGAALGYLSVQGALSPTILGGLGLAFAGLVGGTAVRRLASFPSYDEADGLSAGLLIRAKREGYTIAGVVLGMVAYAAVVVALSAVLA